MPKRVNYGEDYLVSVPLIDGGGTEFLAAIPTIAAGDAKIDRDSFMAGGVRQPGLQINPTARILGFDSMSELPEPGDVLNENGGDGVATVMFVIAVGGTDLGTGDVSGFMFVKNVSGTWTDNAQIDIAGGSANVATVDAGTTGVYTLATNQIANTAGLFAFAKGKAWLAITAEELTCKELEWRLKDQTATEEWEDTSDVLETEAHPAAKYPNGARFAGIIGDPANDLVSATAINIPMGAHADAHDWFDDAGVIPPATDDRLNGMSIYIWDEDDPDLFEQAQIAGWDADGGGANEGLLTLAGRGLTREADLDGATTLRYVIYEDYYLVPDALGTQAKLDVTAAVPTAAQIQAELEENGASVLDTIADTVAAKLASVSGQVASQSEVTAIQNNTRVVRVVPNVIERPLAGSREYRIELFLYDETGNMEAPDSAPTIALVDQGGTDLSARLDSTTMALVEAGRYRAIYTSDAAHDVEQLVWTFSVVEGGNTRKYGNVSVIVDVLAVDFTAADRAKLDTLHDTRLTAARAANLDEITAARLAELDPANLPADVAAVATAVGDVPTNAELATALAAADDAVLAAVAALENLSNAQLVAAIAAGDDAVLAAIAALDTLIDSIIAEVVTASGEPGQGAPPVSASLRDKVNYLYKAWRNKSTQTGTEHKLFADDGVTVDQKRTIGDDLTTFSAAEVVTGP